MGYLCEIKKRYKLNTINCLNTLKVKAHKISFSRSKKKKKSNELYEKLLSS